MSGTPVTISALGTGLASVGALLAYPLACAPTEVIAENSFRPVRRNWLLRLFDGFHRKRTLVELSDLDDRMLRDIGLARGILLTEHFRTIPRRSNSSEFDLPELHRH